MLADLTRNISLVRLSGIVRRLIQDGVPLHNVRALMAGLLIADPAQKDDDTVVNLLRLTLRDSLCARLSGGKNELYVVELGDHLALELSDASQRSGGLASTMLPPERLQGLREQIAQLLSQSPFALSRITVVAASQVRVAAADVLRFVDARTSVLAWDELSDDLAVRSLGTLE